MTEKRVKSEDLSKTKELKTIKSTSTKKKGSSSSAAKKKTGSTTTKRTSSTSAKKKTKTTTTDKSETSTKNSQIESAPKLEPQEVKQEVIAETSNNNQSDSVATNKSGKKIKQIRVKKKPERLGFNWFFWISFIVLMVPVSYFAYLLYQASLESNVPIVGERIKTEIETEITESQLSNIKTQVLALSGIEKCEVNLVVETLRINADTEDTLTADQLKELNKSIYEIVNAELPIDNYFTSHYEWKQYDLEINSFTNLKADDCIIAVLNKNSRMEEYRNQVVSNSVNETEAKRLKELAEQQRIAEEEEKQRAEEDIKRSLEDIKQSNDVELEKEEN